MYKKNLHLFYKFSSKKISSIITLLSLFVFFIINSNNVYSTSLNELDYIKLKIDNVIGFDTTIENDFSISKFDVNSYFLPQSYNGSQYLNSFESNFEDDYKILSHESSTFLQFNLKESISNKNQIKNIFELESTITKPKINQKNIYPIPINEISSEDKIYLEFKELVDLNDKIKNQASQLATGEDDLFIISTKIANWITKDITYDLKSVLENPDQTSTEVFESKQGVCKEITNLFTSMMRSIGVPTRFVTGYAYTNSEELVNYVGSNWGGHVWAEVLIGDTWVPFDLTYNQYGFVDATHVITDKSPFIRNNGVSLDALSYGLQIVPNTLSLNNEFEIVKDKENIFDPGFDVELSGPEQLSFDSFGYVTAKVTNKMPFYQNIFLNFAKADEIEYINEENVDNIYVFKPYEEKEIHFKYKVPQLDENYKYTFPFLVYNEFIESSLNVEVSKNYKKFDELKIPEQKQKQTFYTNNNLYYNCNYALVENPNLINVNCIIQNPNNFEIKNLKTCISENNCKTLDLTVNELTQITFETKNKETQIISEYNGLTEKINLNFKYPKISTSHVKEFQQIEFSTEVLNHIPNTKLKISMGDITIFDDSISELEIFKLTANPNNQTFKFVLYFEDLIFDEFQTDIFIEQTPLLTQIKNWFDKNLFRN